jgi:signal transduction histidine kinase
MGLRAKLALSFFALVVAVVFAISALQIDRTMTQMVGDLERSGDLLINQAFEQIRTTVNRARGDPVKALRNDASLLALLDSSRAFGRGVVYARVESTDGSIIMSSPPGSGADDRAAPPFSILKQSASSWAGLARIYLLWDDSTYEIRGPFVIDNRPAGVIAVGLSTALTARELRRSAHDVVLFVAIAVALGVAGAMFIGGALLRPVVAIASGVEALAAGRQTSALRIGGRDELSTLAEKFNLLSQRICLDRVQWERERGQYFNIFRSITDAVLLLDSSGALLFANGEAAGRLGLPAGGVTDGKPLRLLLDKNHPLVRMIDTAYATGTEVHNGALQIGEGDDAMRLLVSIFSLGHGVEPAGLLVIARDLEPVRQLETVVDHSGRLARLGALISGIGHQIRNPLNAMNLQLELLTQDAQKGKPVEPRLESVRREIRRFDQAVDALMRFMKPEQLRLAQIRLNDLMAEIASQVSRGGIRVEYNFDPRVATVAADRALLAEALRNVANNAVEAMSDNGGGTLRLATTRTDDGFVQVSIADQGPGIPAEHLERIFQLYFTTKPGGSGLGLSLAARAIDLHRGTVDVQSEVGRGTKVTIRIPIAGQTLPIMLDDAIS